MFNPFKKKKEKEKKIVIVNLCKKCNTDLDGFVRCPNCGEER